MAKKIHFSTNINTFFRLIRQRGVFKTLQVTVSYFADYLFDIIHKTDTFSFVELEDLGIDAPQKAHAEMYQPTHAYPLRKLFNKLSFPPGKILVDLGCGKGRVLLIASEFDFKEVRGIEFSSLLCEIAEKNCSIYKARTKTDTNFVIILSDVINYIIKDDEAVFFLFNPFDEHILKQVLHNILESLQRCNRKIWIIYRKALHRKEVEEIINPTSAQDFTFWGFDFVVFEVEFNTPCTQN